MLIQNEYCKPWPNYDYNTLRNGPPYVLRGYMCSWNANNEQLKMLTKFCDYLQDLRIFNMLISPPKRWPSFLNVTPKHLR